MNGGTPPLRPEPGLFPYLLAMIRTRRSPLILLLAGALLPALSGCRSVQPPTAVLPAAAAPPLVSCGDGISGHELLKAPLVIVGALHGTAEIPAALGHLACQAAVSRQGEPILVGLEIPSSTQEAIDAFLESAGDAAAMEGLLAAEHWQREYQDGRSSKAMLDLLERIRRDRKSGLPIEVLAVDPGFYDEPNRRDSGMATNLIGRIEATHPAQTLVLVGNVHSRTRKGYPWNDKADYTPLGAHLRARYSDLIALDVANSGGTAWICLSDKAAECGVRPQGSLKVDGPVPRIVLDPTAAPRPGHDGAFFIGTVTASPPAVPHRR